MIKQSSKFEEIQQCGISLLSAFITPPSFVLPLTYFRSLRCISRKIVHVATFSVKNVSVRQMMS